MALRCSRFVTVLAAPALCALLAGAALAEPAPPLKIAGSFGFDVHRPKQVCAKVAGALLTRLSKDYHCAPPDNGGETGSGVTSVATCTPKVKRESEYMLFATAGDCNKERETQLANGG
jgi:hypothetical protein